MTVNNWYACYVLIGVGVLFSGQVFINIGVTAGLLPTKGLTLPFVSYGGSSLLCCCGIMGVLLRLSDQLHSYQVSVRTTRLEPDLKPKQVQNGGRFVAK